jgi:hypothetical protein
MLFAEKCVVVLCPAEGVSKEGEGRRGRNINP